VSTNYLAWSKIVVFPLSDFVLCTLNMILLEWIISKIQEENLVHACLWI
jgi:hypothetical protein